MLGGKKLTASKPLKEYAGLFNDLGFFRVHKSHLVNIKLVQRFERSDGGHVIMDSGEKVPVSSYKRDGLLEFLETL